VSERVGRLTVVESSVQCGRKSLRSRIGGNPRDEVSVFEVDEKVVIIPEAEYERLIKAEHRNTIHLTIDGSKYSKEELMDALKSQTL